MRFIAASWMLCFLSLVGTVASFQAEISHSNLSVYLDDQGAAVRIRTVADWERRRAQILKGFQRAAGNLSQKIHTEKWTATELGQSTKLNYSIRTIVIRSGNRPPIYCDVYFPKGVQTTPAKKLPAILALHPTGLPGKKLIGGDSPKKNRQYANELASRGYVVIAPDYPSFGQTVGHDFSSDGFESGTLLGIANHIRCVDYLVSLPVVDSERIGVIGHSLGGHNAIFAALFDQRLKAIVSSCGWTPFHDYYGGKIAGWTSDRYMPKLKTEYGLDPDRVPFDFYELTAALAPRPFFTSAPIDDSNFDIAGVKKTQRKIEPIYRLFRAEQNLVFRYPPCQHDFPTEIRQEAYQFLDKNLNHQPANDVQYKAELPRLKPLEPEAALKSIQGKKVTLVACEPNVSDPIAVSFDAKRNMYVVEMIDYSEQEQDHLGQVRRLQDQDGDGFYETSEIFADKISWPTAIICFDGGLFVGAAPDIWFLKDEDGDGKSDIRKKVFTGFGRSNVQGLMNCFRWGLDNRIHGATSSSGANVRRVDDLGKPIGKPLTLRNADFSFDPIHLDIRRETGGAQHGMCFDDWGYKYVCSNSDHAQMIRFDDRYLSNNRWLRSQPARIRIADDGGQAPVFRTSPVEPWREVRTRLRVAGLVRGPVEGGGTAAGYFTGSTGITIYRGDSDTVEKGTAIIGDVGSNIVHRKSVQRNGLTVTASRIDPMSEWVSSRDNWFRPVQFANAPDGCLYILDMYREVIEHPKSLPPEIKTHLDLTSGRDRGRIYRIGTAKLKRRLEEGELSPELPIGKLVKFLNHPNAWHRETAARLIFERQDVTAVPFLQTVRVQNFSVLGRMHALYALAGLKRLKLDDLMIACQDAEPEVRRHAILLAEQTNPEWLMDPAFKKLVNDRSPRVRLQMAFSLAKTPKSYRLPLLWRLIRLSLREDPHPLMVTAILSSADGLQVPLISKLFSQEMPQNDFKTELMEQIARRNSDEDVAGLASLIHQQITVEHNGKARKIAETIFQANREMARRLAAHSDLKSWFNSQIDQAASNLEESEELAKQVEAVSFLGFASRQRRVTLWLSALDRRQFPDVQRACLKMVSRETGPDIGTALIKSRNQQGPQWMSAVDDVIFSRPQWAIQLMEKTDVTIPASRLSILAASKNATLQKLAAARIEQTIAPSKSKLIEEYSTALDTVSDSENGKKLFQKHCSACHRADGIGHELGPNLTSMKSRGKLAILTNVLAPNREVNPQFQNYAILLNDGRQVSGVIVSESPAAIVLSNGVEKNLTYRRDNIEAIKPTGSSLMPEGLEKEIRPEEMADLIEFLMTAR